MLSGGLSSGVSIQCVGTGTCSNQKKQPWMVHMHIDILESWLYVQYIYIYNSNICIYIYINTQLWILDHIFCIISAKLCILYTVVQSMCMCYIRVCNIFRGPRVLEAEFEFMFVDHLFLACDHLYLAGILDILAVISWQWRLANDVDAKETARFERIDTVH